MEGFRPLCNDNSSYTRYPGRTLPDEILEEALSRRSGSGPYSLRSRPLGWSLDSLREKRRSTVAALVPELSLRTVLSDASSAYRLDSISSPPGSLAGCAYKIKR